MNSQGAHVLVVLRGEGVKWVEQKREILTKVWGEKFVAESHSRAGRFMVTPPPAVCWWAARVAEIAWQQVLISTSQLSSRGATWID